MRKRILIAFVCFLSVLFCSCKTVIDWNEQERTVLKVGSQTMSDTEMRSVALAYKDLYEHYYRSLLSDSFWSAEIDEGTTFETYVKNGLILNECTAVLRLNLIADKEQIQLGEERKALLHERAEAFYAGMTEDERAFSGADSRDLYNLLLKYDRAYRTVAYLLEGRVIEISVEAGRVIDIEVIHTNTYEDAVLLKERLNNGENFRTLAMENTVDPVIDYSVSRADLFEPFPEILFALPEGGISEPVDLNGGYIFRISKSYNVLLSLKNKHNMLANLKYSNLSEMMDTYNISGDVRVNHAFFEKLSLHDSGDYAAHSLFDCLEN